MIHEIVGAAVGFGVGFNVGDVVVGEPLGAVVGVCVTGARVFGNVDGVSSYIPTNKIIPKLRIPKVTVSQQQQFLQPIAARILLL